MDAARAENLYAKLVKQAEAEASAVKTMSTKAWARWTDAVADAVFARANEILPAIDGADQTERFKQVGSLLGAVDAERAIVPGLDEAGYVTWLLRWNKWFRQQQVKLNLPPIGHQRSFEILTEIHNASWQKDAGFKAFCLAVSDAHRRIFDMRKAFADAGLPQTDIYTAMHFLQQHALPVDALTDNTATDLHHLSTKAPPLTAFGGYADWGPGNHGSIPANKEGHFLKHVLDAHPKEDLPWQGECAIWWKALDLKFTREDAEGKLGALWHKVMVHFPAEPKGQLPFDKVEAVIGVVKAGGGWPALLKGQFVASHAAAYAAFALNLSRTMSHAIVHTYPTKAQVLVKGVKDPYYIGGRMEGSVLGLSTCFVPKPGTDLVNLHEATKIWRVSPL